jgi:hypothetical protein
MTSVTTKAALSQPTIENNSHLFDDWLDRQNRPAASRRPWPADPMPGGYVVRDANGQALAYLYFREKDVEARQAKVLTKDEARRIAVDIARLPELLGKADRD